MTTNAAPALTDDEQFALNLGYQLRALRTAYTPAREGFQADTVAHAVQWKLAPLVVTETQLAILETAVSGGTVAAQRRLLSDELGRYLVNPSAYTDPFSRALAETQRDAAMRLLGLFKEHVDLTRVFRYA